jgi:hypothetical protein
MMDQLTRLIEGLWANPLLCIAIGAGTLASYCLLRRKPKIQRDADERLAALRRDKTDQ